MFIDNNWYGNSFILAKYCKRPETKIFGSLQHGLLLVSAYKFFNKKSKLGIRRFQSVPWFVWNSKIYNECNSNNIRNVIPIGSTFIYLDKLLKNKIYSKPKGTIVIPRKSDSERNYKINYPAMIKFLKQKKHKKPYKILVGNKDYLNLKNLKIKDVKFITCGKRVNKYFTFKIYKFIKESTELVSFYPGTPILYSSFLKKKTYYYRKNFIKSYRQKFVANINYQKKFKNILGWKNLNIKEIKTYDEIMEFSFIKDHGINLKNLNTRKNYDLILDILGNKHIKKPNDLIYLFGWKSNLKKFISELLSIIIKYRYKQLIN